MVFLKKEVDIAHRAVTLFGNNNFRIVSIFRILLILTFPVHKRHYVSVCLNTA